MVASFRYDRENTTYSIGNGWRRRTFFTDKEGQTHVVLSYRWATTDFVLVNGVLVEKVRLPLDKNSLHLWNIPRRFGGRRGTLRHVNPSLG